MKAIQITEYGGPEVLRYTDLPDPTAGPGQAVVAIQAVGVNFTDIYSRMGVNPPGLPWVAGVEAAGVVRQIGPDVADVAVGDTVAYCSHPGSYAELAAVPAWRLIKMPAGLSARDGAAAMLQGMTAHYLCYDTYRVQPGDRVLVHSGAGGVGLLLIQMCKALGAYVYTTVSTQFKADLARGAGADYVIRYTEQDFAAEIARATDGAGLNAVYDAVGKDTFDGSLASLAPRGCLALYGQASGAVPPVDPRRLGNGSKYLTRPGLGDYTANRAELEQRAAAVLGWVQSGELKLRVAHDFPLSDAAEAHRQLAGRATTGKIILTP